MFGLGNLGLYGLGFVAVVAIAGGIWLHGEHYGYGRGFAAANEQVVAANNRAVQAAERARADLLRECRSDPDRCLSDDFTRDRGDRVPPVQPNSQQH